MEPSQAKMKIHMGEFDVVEVKPYGAITINLGRNVHITIHIGDFPHNIKTGDRLPLFTEIHYAQPEQTPVQ